jgi:hypothetical protein
MNPKLFWIAGIVLFLVIVFAGVLFYQRLTSSIDVTVKRGPGIPAPTTSSQPIEADEA